MGGFFFEFEPSCRTQAARLQDEADSQFEIINKLESECRRHRDKAEKAKKEASRIDGEKGSAEAEKRRGEAEVRSRRPVVLWCLHFLNTTRVHLTMKWVVSFSILSDRDAPRRREQLQSEGIVFRSQTDTEVIAQLIGRELDAQPDIELRDAVSRSLQKCEGTWGVAVLSVKDPDSVVVACNGSPMNIGLAPGKTFIASETSAFNRHTKNFIAMSRSRRPVLRCLQLVAISR